MRDRAARGRRGSSGLADIRPRGRPGGGVQVRRRELSRSAHLETIYPPSLAQILPTVVPGRARGLWISVRPRTPLRRGAEGARRASGKLHGKDEVARSDPLPLATCERQRLPGAGSVPDCQRRVVQPHGGDQAGGVGRLAAGCGIRTAEVGPVSRTAGSVRRIRTAEVGAGQRRDMWIRVQRAPHVGNDEAVISNSKAPTALSIGVRATRGGARR